MNSLFIRLYLDEDVNVLVADLLQARGFDVKTARDAGQLHATDPEQFAYAVSQARTLVTHPTIGQTLRNLYRFTLMRSRCIMV